MNDEKFFAEVELRLGITKRQLEIDRAAYDAAWATWQKTAEYYKALVAIRESLLPLRERGSK